MENTNQKNKIIEIKGLYKSFGINHVLNNFDLNLFEGENLVIMGKSGCGKSVMVKCLIGLMKPDRGSIKVMGEDITTMDQKRLNQIRPEIGFLFQGNALYDSMTVRENLEFPLRHHRKRLGVHQTTTTAIQNVLNSVGLIHAIDLMPSELSGGMKKRVAIARTLILQPKIILYDEPTSGLDPITAKEIIILIKEIQKKHGTSSIIITHDVDCARVISERMLLLIDGTNYALGTFKELSIAQDPKIKAFFKQ